MGMRMGVTSYFAINQEENSYILKLA